MGVIPFIWGIAKDSVRAELRLKGVSNEANMLPQLLGNVVMFVELAEQFGGKEKEGLTPEDFEETFKAENLPFMQAILMSRANTVVYFGLEFESMEARDQFVSVFNKANN